jgi:hypothetical protein
LEPGPDAQTGFAYGISGQDPRRRRASSSVAGALKQSAAGPFLLKHDPEKWIRFFAALTFGSEKIMLKQGRPR